MFTPRARRLAAGATVAFTVVGVAGALLTVRDWVAALPLLGFYALLLINSYFSIRCFSSIVPRPTAAQIVVDGVLVGVYVFLAFQFAEATRFLWTSIGLFLVANVKYILMLGTPGHATLLIRKMILDILGAAACGLALAGVMAGLPQTLGWWLGAFFAANIYILGVSRLYIPVADASASR